MTVVGIIYFNRFADQIDARQVERLQTAAELINQNRLNLTSLTDRNTMSLLVGEEIQDAMLITDKGIVAFSLNPEYRRMAIADIPFLDKNDLNFDHPTPILKRVEIEGRSYLVSITPSPGTDKLTQLALYFRTSVVGAEREKANVIILLLAGFAATVVATSTALTLVLNRTVLARVGKLALAARKVEAGDLTVRAHLDETDCRAEDEITVLQHGFNAMVERLQVLIETLEQRVVERTHELSESNQQLQNAKDVAEQARQSADDANRAKSAFLANMSHELRTPLNAILGFSQLMKNDPNATAEQMDNLNIITRSGEHLLNLINNALDLSKIEAGRVTLEETTLDLHQLMQELRSLMHVRAEEKGLNFTVEQSSEVPRYIRVDAVKLRQVLINLIGNAIKYTNEGHIALRVRKSQTTNDKLAMTNDKSRHLNDGICHLGFEVVDTGTGIREEDRSRIFAPFVQLANQSAGQAGTGLGLALSKEYVELMGGQIGVSSELGKGSVFHVELPVAVLSPEEPQIESSHGRVMGLAAGQPCYRLLIVEDQADNRLLLRRLLEPLGFEVREAVNGQDAVAQWAAWSPDLIWMDMRMPGMDGLEATRRIKATEAGARIKIIALTAHALEDERREILAVGCDDFIRKPYREQEVFEALAKHLGVRFVYAEEAVIEAVAAQPDVVALTALPNAVLNELEQALRQLEPNAINRAIDDVRSYDVILAGALSAMARNFQYGEVLRLIETVHGEEIG